MALAIRYTAREEDEYIKTIDKVNQEMFVRYHRPAPKFARILLTSVGDIESHKNFIDADYDYYSSTAIYLPVECRPVNNRTFSTLEDTSLWIVMLSMFRKNKLSEIFRFSIDKDSELIRDRDLIIL